MSDQKERLNNLMFERRDLITHSSHIAFWNGMNFISIRTATALPQFKNELIKCISPPKKSILR